MTDTVTGNTLTPKQEMSELLDLAKDMQTRLKLSGDYKKTGGPKGNPLTALTKGIESITKAVSFFGPEQDELTMLEYVKMSDVQKAAFMKELRAISGSNKPPSKAVAAEQVKQK